MNRIDHDNIKTMINVAKNEAVLISDYATSSEVAAYKTEIEESIGD